MGLGGRNLQTHSQQTGDQPSPAAQQPPTPGQVPDTIGHQASDEVLAIRSKFGRQQRVPTTWQHLKIDDRYQPQGKGNADNHTYVVSSNTLGCLEQAPGTRQQQLAQHGNGNNAGGGESMSRWVKNGAVIALIGLLALVVAPFALPQYGVNLTPGAPRDNGVTIEQISTAVNDGIKPLASAVSDNTASIADLREDQQDLKNRVDDLAAIRGGTAATPAPPNLNQVDCTEPGESGSTYTVGWMYRDAIGCPWFIVLEVDDNTGEILKYDWLPDSCVPMDSKDMGHEPDNYPNCTNVPTPRPEPEKPIVDDHFPPVLFDAQSCGPEHNEDGGCVEDVGAHEYRVTWDGREVAQVGIVKGVNIRWNGLDDNSHGRCELVIIPPGNWLENLNYEDARWEIYDVDASRVWATSDQDPGWLFALAMQAVAEQADNYGCPRKDFDEIPQWTSGITSPPCSVEGFNSCGEEGSNPNPDTNTWTPRDPQPAAGNNNGNQGKTNRGNRDGNCDTVNCKERRATIVVNPKTNIARFKAGEAVDGAVVNIGGRLVKGQIKGGTTYTVCHFTKAPGAGFVKDGVVNYWKTEGNSRRCQ